MFASLNRLVDAQSDRLSTLPASMPSLLLSVSLAQAATRNNALRRRIEEGKAAAVAAAAAAAATASATNSRRGPRGPHSPQGPATSARRDKRIVAASTSALPLLSLSPQQESPSPVLFTLPGALASPTSTADRDTRRGKVRRRRWHDKVERRSPLQPRHAGRRRPEATTRSPMMVTSKLSFTSTSTSTSTSTTATATTDTERVGVRLPAAALSSPSPRVAPKRAASAESYQQKTSTMFTAPASPPSPITPATPTSPTSLSSTSQQHRPRPPPGGVLPYLGTALEQRLNLAASPPRVGDGRGLGVNRSGGGGLPSATVVQRLAQVCNARHLQANRYGCVSLSFARCACIWQR